MLLDPHRTIVAYDVDPVVRNAAEPDLVLTFVFQMLNPKLDISGSAEAEAAAEVFPDELCALLARKHAIVREVPPGLDATPVLSGCILHFLSALYNDYSM